MDIAIGLPSTVPGVDRDSVLQWARRAEERGFSSLATLDRLVYPGYEALVTLGAAAAVTERIGLLTDILILPYRGNAGLVAKQALTVDALAGGRLTLGVGIGARGDDYKASDVPEGDRGRLMDEMLAEIRAVWSQEDRGEAGPIGPPPVHDGSPRLLVGGMVDASIRRVVRFGDGWTMGGGRPEDFARMAENVRSAWSEAGRDGQPRLVALCYYALGENARETADKDLLHYYAWLGDVAQAIAQSAAVSEEMITQYRDAFAEAGADELVYFPTSTDVDQVDLLAEVALA
jgi:alkanesulfonate monooxygenase SsuD/methylene tetrahydromethanopterin reductase-like flavin-dependent oxidoreductase (luciferase family)